MVVATAIPLIPNVPRATVILQWFCIMLPLMVSLLVWGGAVFVADSFQAVLSEEDFIARSKRWVLGFFVLSLVSGTVVATYYNFLF